MPWSGWLRKGKTCSLARLKSSPIGTDGIQVGRPQARCARGGSRRAVGAWINGVKVEEKIKSC